MDTLDNLKAFIASAESGSFSQAARDLGLVPSVVAKRVDQLEWRIKAPLFRRSTRRLDLTDVGERYLPAVRALVRDIDTTLDGMARANGALEGPIRIKIPTTLGVLWLGELLNRFLQQQPLVSMEVVLADRSVNPVEEGFDIAIGARPESYGQVEDHPLCPIRRRLCAAPAYLARAGTPATPAELLQHACLVFATSGNRWEFLGPQGEIGVDVPAKLRSNDGFALRRAAVAGQGIALLADYLVEPDLQDGGLVAVLPHLRQPDIWLKALVPVGRSQLPRVRALLAWLSHQLQLQPPAPQADPGRDKPAS